MNGDQERRQRREFEPPPWEQDAFERFQKERADLEKEAALEEALARLDSPVAESVVEAPEEPSAESVAGRTPTAAGDREFPIPAGQMEELMARLREEDPPTTANYGILANAVTIGLGAGGVGFVIWSGILLGRVGPGAGALQMMASLLVMLWGLMMVGFAVLLWRKYNL